MASVGRAHFEPSMSRRVAVSPAKCARKGANIPFTPLLRDQAHVIARLDVHGQRGGHLGKRHQSRCLSFLAGRLNSCRFSETTDSYQNRRNWGHMQFLLLDATWTRRGPVKVMSRTRLRPGEQKTSTHHNDTWHPPPTASCPPKRTTRGSDRSARSSSIQACRRDAHRY